MSETPKSKTVILQWKRGDALINGTYILDTMEKGLKSSTELLEFTLHDIKHFTDKMFGPLDTGQAGQHGDLVEGLKEDMRAISRGIEPKSALDEMKEEIVKALVRTISRKWEGPISLAIQADDLERARDDGCRAHFKDINGGILLTIE